MTPQPCLQHREHFRGFLSSKLAFHVEISAGALLLLHLHDAVADLDEVDHFRLFELSRHRMKSASAIRACAVGYVCRYGGCVETAPGPERAVRGGRYSLAFAVKVALDKYLDHIPLARQERILRRHGVDVTTQTLWDQLSALGYRLASTEAALFAHTLAQSVIGLDQTSWPKLEPDDARRASIRCLPPNGTGVPLVDRSSGRASVTVSRIISQLNR